MYSEYLLDTVPWDLQEKRFRLHPFPKHLPEPRILGNLISSKPECIWVEWPFNLPDLTLQLCVGQGREGSSENGTGTR